MTTQPILRQICTNGIIQQGSNQIKELSINPVEVSQLALISKPNKKNPLIRINMMSGEYYFIEYDNLNKLEKDFKELKTLTNGNPKLE